MKKEENVQRSTSKVQRLNSAIRGDAATCSCASSIESFDVERWTLNVFFSFFPGINHVLAH
jgi:hypothetical protein